MASLAFIGPGKMGLPVAGNLAKAGHRFRDSDRMANAVAGPSADTVFGPDFANGLEVGDLDLAQQAAMEVCLITPMGNSALALSEEFLDDGETGRDFPAIMGCLRPLPGVRQESGLQQIDCMPA